jgi:transposase-like protein
MTEKRRRYSTDFKFRVALEAAKGQNIVDARIWTRNGLGLR